MNQSTYRIGHPHQLHSNPCGALQAFAGASRFPVMSGIDGLNPIMIASITQEEPGQYGQVQSFINNNNHNEHKIEHKIEYPTTSSVGFQSRHCIQGTKNCLECFTKEASVVSGKNKVMVDAATMTNPEDMEQAAANWQNATVSPNTKVAEYLSSLRQFLKLSSTSETKKKLGDVRIVTSPDGSRLYCCPECQMAYPDKSLLEPHLASHKIERRYVCGVCGAGLKRKEHLDRHQLSHSDERPFSCAACPKTFKRNEHLARHYIIHSGEKAQMERRFICGVCGTGHARREHLERHQLAHSEDRPHTCNTCRKTFKRHEHLARHFLTHSGFKPHICLECGKGFYRKDHLSKHLLAHQTKRIRLAGLPCDA